MKWALLSRLRLAGLFLTALAGPVRPGYALDRVRAFLYSGSMMDLSSLIPPGSGWKLVDATGINNAEQITGTGIDQDQMRAFLLAPA